METTFIYGLGDPTHFNKIRYIGKADNPKLRLRDHISKAIKDKENNYKSNWIKTLLAKGLQPTLIILDEVPIDKWEWFEQTWINEYRKLGFKLTNTTDGGNGSKGYICSIENREKISKRLKGNKYFLGRKHSEETLIKMSNIKKGKIVNDETRNKMSVSGKKKVFTNEHKLNLSIAGKQRWAIRKTLSSNNYNLFEE